VPDALLRRMIRRRLRGVLQRLEDAAAGDDAAALRSYAAELAAGPLAIHQDAANRQHYELPTAFFSEFLGLRRKYS
jgi:cyclopropane-fatty-acyl-phospholipid synthase